MTRSKTFWVAAAFISLSAMVFAGYSMYERISLHFSGAAIEVHPVPLPVSEGEAGNSTAAVTEEKAPETRSDAEKAAPEPPGPEKVKAVRVAFEYKDAKAKSVRIAGSFTSWKDVPMARKNGVWKTEIYILPGTYPYHFNADGKKRADPGKPKSPQGDSLAIVAP